MLRNGHTRTGQCHRRRTTYGTVRRVELLLLYYYFVLFVRFPFSFFCSYRIKQKLNKAYVRVLIDM